MTTAPASRACPIQGRGSAKENITTGTPLCQGNLEVLGSAFNQLCDEANAEGAVGLGTDERYLFSEPIGAEAVAAAEGSQAAGREKPQPPTARRCGCS